jgi:SLT domain-containing protein
MNDQERMDHLIDEVMDPKSASCFREIIFIESRNDTKAINPTSGAFGLGQLLPSTYRNIGLKKSSDGLAQSVAALAYISRHYGSGGSCSALKSEHEKNYY